MQHFISLSNISNRPRVPSYSPGLSLSHMPSEQTKLSSSSSDSTRSISCSRIR
ncbi:hypothetical protein ACFOLD_03650 [Kocuria carniphila]|uniref:hypothetical protein n=1 Tax=Kocuria carniphila TaxID=262208 RepID=UPI003612C88D